MKIDLSIDRARVPRHIDEPILVAVRVVNDGGEPLPVCTELSESPSVILTSYGDAKVADPASFEALDDAHNLVYPGSSAGGSGYRGGYGRDSVAVYFFDEGTSTHHAVRLRGCKDPSRFVALAHGHGKDDRNVYREAAAIRGADPATWTLPSRMYSRDTRAVFYGTTRIADADPATFQVLDTPGRPGTAFESLWARDARGYFERILRRSEAEYQSVR